jgi:hypothetical protein
MRSISTVFYRLVAACMAAWVLWAEIQSARADIYVLSNDGQVRGELVNKDEVPRQKYVIKTVDGAVITLERAQVKQIVPQLATEMEYEKIRPTFADTVADQWKLAEWCREKTMTKARQAALERIIELEPNHKQARLALGYMQENGRWVQPDQLMQERGYVRYNHEWRLPQEVELEERKQQDDKTKKQWFVDVKRWSGWLDDANRASQARDQLRAINDPLAVPALAQALNTETDRQVRSMYVDVLGRIGTPAVQTLVAHAMDDADEEIRLKCLDQLVAKPDHAAVADFVSELKSKDNTRVNQAGFCLGKLGDKTAISPLIEALVTTHKFIVQDGSGNPGQMSAGFSPTGQGGAGMSMGGGPKSFTRALNNQHVLDALVSMTGMNFQFDQRAWKNWFATQKKPANIDARRD